MIMFTRKMKINIIKQAEYKNDNGMHLFMLLYHANINFVLLMNDHVLDNLLHRVVGPYRELSVLTQSCRSLQRAIGHFSPQLHLFIQLVDDLLLDKQRVIGPYT